MPWVAAAGAAAQAAGPVLGYLLSKKERDAAKKAQEDAINALLNSPTAPTPAELSFTPEELSSLGQYTPEELQALTLGPSAMEGVSTDPRLAQAQMAALASLQSRMGGGLNAEDQAALNEVQRRTVNQATSQRANILQSMAQRGMGGAGAELAMQQMASQEASDRASQEGDRQAALALQARMAAAQQAGSLGGQIREQSFGEQQKVASAKDLVNQFNVRNQQDVSSHNVGARNTAQQQNLSNAQAIANANVALRNAKSQADKDLIYKKYQDDLARAKLLASAHGQNAGWQGQLADQTMNTAVGVGTGVGQGIYGVGSAIAGSQKAEPTAQFSAANTALPSYDPNKYSTGNG